MVSTKPGFIRFKYFTLVKLRYHSFLNVISFLHDPFMSLDSRSPSSSHYPTFVTVRTGTESFSLQLNFLFTTTDWNKQHNTVDAASVRTTSNKLLKILFTKCTIQVAQNERKFKLNKKKYLE